MTRKPSAPKSTKDVSELNLKNARLSVKLNSNVIVGRVSALFAGPTRRSIRFTFFPKSVKSAQGIEAIEFELPKVEAWALAEWMTDQAMTRSPSRPEK